MTSQLLQELIQLIPGLQAYHLLQPLSQELVVPGIQLALHVRGDTTALQSSCIRLYQVNLYVHRHVSARIKVLGQTWNKYGQDELHVMAVV